MSSMTLCHEKYTLYLAFQSMLLICQVYYAGLKQLLLRRRHFFYRLPISISWYRLSQIQIFGSHCFRATFVHRMACRLSGLGGFLESQLEPGSPAPIF